MQANIETNVNKDIKKKLLKTNKTDYTKYKRKGVYNRKILRNMLKHSMKTNKIREAWHALRKEGKI